ncbi:4684_t:CDS:2 [Ambispora leptoticha]|uniref:carbonic anhydrase n=1 Tax=Ambispora leptoticha TaxID=144679 RepID=A0A9N9G6N7_9GLOM|nr:4684_t:CDS:2 [Ambispora leptoticha]
MNKIFFILCLLVLGVVIDANDYGYTAYNGPASDNEAWNSPLCKSGKLQSPINIDSSLFGNSVKNATSFVNNLPNDYKLSAKNTGETIKYTSTDNSLLDFKLVRNGVEYKLQNFHFHTPSEHRINNRHSDSEIHFVFQTDLSGNASVAVVGFLLNVDITQNYALDLILNASLVPAKINETKTIVGPNLGDFFGKTFDNKNVYQYVGSLTVPKCTEGLFWHVSGVVQPIFFRNFLNLRDIIGFSARRVQASPDHAGQPVGASSEH